MLVEYLLCELDEEATNAIDLHLANGCELCHEQIQDLSSGFDLLYSVHPGEELDDEKVSGIVQNVRLIDSTRHSLAGKRLGNIPGTERSCMTTHGMPRKSLAMVVASYAMSVAAGFLVMMTLQPNFRMESSMDIAKDLASVGTSKSQEMQPSQLPEESRISAKRNGSTYLVAMDRAGTSSGVEGRILWDPLAHEVHLFGRITKVPQQGMRYILWLMDDHHQVLEKVELETSSSGACKATLCDASMKLSYIVVSLESRIAGFQVPSKQIELTLDASRLNCFSL